VEKNDDPLSLSSSSAGITKFFGYIQAEKVMLKPP
jgi:hypothetical protein